MDKVVFFFYKWTGLLVVVGVIDVLHCGKGIFW